ADDLRLEPRVLAAAIEADRAAGLRPACVVANGGATSTGAVDPLGEIADFCGDAGIWLHVDAAYGGFAVLTERGARVLDGIERAAAPSLGVVCLRRTDLADPDDAVDGVIGAVERSGRGLVSGTRVHGERVLRLCILNHTTTAADVDEVLELLATVEPVRAAAQRERDETVATETLAPIATRRRVGAGETIVEQWETGDELYVIAAGT